MQVSLQLALDVILGITPVPGLSAGFNLLKLIVSSVRQARESKRQLEALAYTVAQLLETLNAEFRASRLIQSASDRPLQDLHRFKTRFLLHFGGSDLCA
ncbi:hypothetical protein FB451DRAFT_287257 [Mycena latifolia]|nr:hypothetical protein FB451DRAFT_287257 [Mycena latifolia]